MKSLYRGYNNYEEVIYCFSDYDNQISNDKIRINVDQKYGSIKWLGTLNEDNNEVRHYPNEYKSISMELVDSYDMYFSNNKWFFTILSKSSNNPIELAKYKVDINIKRYTKENIRSTADCYLIEGFITNDWTPEDIRLICSCKYDNQNQDDLITLLYPKSNDATIIWSKDFVSPYAITLKTSLNLIKTVWDSKSNLLNIEVADGIFYKFKSFNRFTGCIPLLSLLFG